MARESFFRGRRGKKSIYGAGVMGLVLVFLSACGPMKAYDGAVLEPGEISVIRPDTEKAFTQVRILKINDYAVNRFDTGVQVRSGENTIFVQVTLDFPYLHGFFHFCQTLTFKTAPGKNYTVYGRISPLLETGYIWVEADQVPGETVAGSLTIPTRTDSYPHCKKTG